MQSRARSRPWPRTTRWAEYRRGFDFRWQLRVAHCNDLALVRLRSVFNVFFWNDSVEARVHTKYTKISYRPEHNLALTQGHFKFMA